jgi:CSLREA domain-containing protein
MTQPASQKSPRRRGLHLSRTKRKALRRRSQPALRYWTFLTRCFTSLRRRPAFRLIRVFKRLRAAFGALTLACWLPSLAQAETFTVTTTSDTSAEDDGVLTLREAITLANENDGPDTIDFTEDLSGAVIKLTQGELAISDDLSIDASDLADAPTIDADQKSRVMHFTESQGDLTLTKLTLRNGKTTARDDGGGGILFSSSGTLTLHSSTVSRNQTGGYSPGGGIHSGAGAIVLNHSVVSENSGSGRYGSPDGIHSGAGAITLNHSVVSGNSGSGIGAGAGSITLNHSVVSGNSGESGGGISTFSGVVTLTNSTICGNSGEGTGGISTFSGAVTLTNSTISGNSATYGGGIHTSSGAVTLTNSTISRNSGDSYGGGIHTYSGAVTLTNSTICGNYGFYGGGIHTYSGAVTLTSATISGNSGAYGGGIGTFSGAVTLTNTTISGNSSAGYFDSGVGHFGGGGISSRSGAVILRNSIIAENSDDGTAPDIKAPDDPGSKLEVSHCLIGNSTGARLDEAKLNENNLIDVDPLLAPLADNGGPTQTILPYPESPVINAGAPTGQSADQRGLALLGAPDIGAVEFQGTSDLRRVLPLDHDGDGSSYQIEKAVGTNPFVADPHDPRFLQRPTFNADGQAVLSFGISETALTGTRWVLERTTDLRTFEAIHRFDGTEHHAYEGRPVTITQTDTGVSVVDEAPPAGRVFYRLRIVAAE